VRAIESILEATVRSLSTSWLRVSHREALVLDDERLTSRISASAPKFWPGAFPRSGSASARWPSGFPTA
jgi:hypothetical protein